MKDSVIIRREWLTPVQDCPPDVRLQFYEAMFAHDLRFDFEGLGNDIEGLQEQVKNFMDLVYRLKERNDE